MENTSIMASITLVGDEFDTDFVTSLLNKQPDYLRIKGAMIRKGLHARFTEWGIHVDEAESLDSNTHLIPIFNFIETNLEQLQQLSAKLNAEWHIVVCINILNERTPGIGFSPRQLELASAIKAHIGFDLYAQQFNIDDMASLDKCPLCGH